MSTQTAVDKHNAWMDKEGSKVRQVTLANIDTLKSQLDGSNPSLVALFEKTCTVLGLIVDPRWWAREGATGSMQDTRILLSRIGPEIASGTFTPPAA